MSVISDDRRRVVERHFFDDSSGEVATLEAMVPFVTTSLEVVVNGRLEVQGGRYSTQGDQQVVFAPPLGDGDVLFLTYLPLHPPGSTR